MKDTAQAGTPPVLIENLQAIRPCFPAMDDDGFSRGARLIELMAEYIGLDVARRMIVVVIEANFPPGDGARILGQPVQFHVVRICRMPGLVRMNPRGRINPIVLSSIGNGRSEFFQLGAIADGQQCSDTRGARCSSMASRSASKSETSTCACESTRVMVFSRTGFSLLVFSSRIAKSKQAEACSTSCYFSRAPTGTSSRNPASTGAPSGKDAATIMPFDSTPRSFRGCRFVTTTTLRPTRSSGL